MQTLQFTRALRRIVQQLKVKELIDFLQPYVATNSNFQVQQSHKDQFSDLLFSSRTGYERLIEDAPTAKILSSLKINAIYQPARLGKLLTILSQVPASGNVVTTPGFFAEFFTFLELLQSLANFEKACSDLLEKEKLGQVASPDKILELQLIDYDGTGIEVVRLERFVSSLTQLHTAFARILGISGDRLRFIYFDSGSDLIAGIQCAKLILENIRTLLSEWWDKIRFRGYEEFDRKMDAVSKSLTVMGTVQQAVDSNVIDEETGNLLKTRVLVEVDNLIGIGATLPIHEDVERVDHRKLLTEKRDTKLLGSGAAEEPDGNPTANTQD
jgi:hypothetical protein